VVVEEIMLGWRTRISWRTLAALLGGAAVVGGLALARDAPLAAASTPVAAASAPSGPATPPPGMTAPAQPAPVADEGRLEQLVAPIALYPDPLLAQILMAATYPLEIVEGARWIALPANRALTGEALTGALAAQDWDPSVKALVAFPPLLETMSDKLQWTQDLGNAFLARQADVMAAVQRLRRLASAAGTLATTPQCDCNVERSGDTIAIPPAEPEDIRVPVYGPEAYGPWPYPAYPPDELPAPQGFAYWPDFSIGFEPPVDLAPFGPLWGWNWIDWPQTVIIIVNVHEHAHDHGGRHGRFAGRPWVHDPAHRRAVRYADAATRARFEAARASAIAARVRAAADVQAPRFDDAERLAALRGAAAHEIAARSGTVTVIRGAAALRDSSAFAGPTAFRAEPAVLHGSGPIIPRVAGRRDVAVHFASTPHGGSLRGMGQHPAPAASPARTMRSQGSYSGLRQ
jgi:hypothetical protein